MYQNYLNNVLLNLPNYKTCTFELCKYSCIHFLLNSIVFCHFYFERIKHCFYIYYDINIKNKSYLL